MLMTGELVCICFFFCFKQKTAYEMRISDWSSDVCSSDLVVDLVADGVDLGVALHDLAGEVAVALDHRLDGAGQLRFGNAAHLDDQGRQLLQLFVVALDDMLCRHRSILVQLSRSGR